MHLIEIANHFKSLQEKYVLKYDPTKQYFNIGDKAWIFDGYFSIPVKITYVQNFSKEKNDGGYIFYFYHYESITILDNVKLYFDYYVHLILSFFKIQKPYIPNYKFGSGHGELVGRNEVLFLTPEQAELDFYFTTIIQFIENLIDLSI